MRKRHQLFAISDRSRNRCGDNGNWVIGMHVFPFSLSFLSFVLLLALVAIPTRRARCALTLRARNCVSRFSTKVFSPDSR